MYSSLFCETLVISTQDNYQKKQENLDVKLYEIELLKFYNLVSGTKDFLSDSERDQANRYHFIKDKNRFIICRTLLKFLLAEHTGLTIDKIIISNDSNKKPFLAFHPSIFFNVTHAGDYAIIAIAKSPVGVDIEHINKEFDYKEILPTVFNQVEINEIANSNDKHLAFYTFWTRKEAIVKATGKGIEDTITQIPATNGLHSVPSTLLSGFNNINVFSFNINPDYIGAIAVTKNVNNPNQIQFYPIPEFDVLNDF